MASNKRKAKRKHKPSAQGDAVPLHKRKVQKSQQNAGGFYKEMPGVSIDDQGNRKMIDFVITPDGEKNAYIYANPFIVKAAIRDTLKENKELRSLLISGFVDYLFSKRANPLHLLLRLAFRLKTAVASVKYNRLKRKHGQQIPKN